jgi:hypothetical protein
MTTEIETVYQTALATIKSTAGQRSFGRIKTACDTLERHGKPINAATVGKECRVAFKGPSAGTIRNSKTYMEYIKARSDAAVVAKVAEESFTPEVEDPVLAAYISTLKGRLNVSEHKNRIFRKYLETRVEPLDVDKFLAEQDPTRYGHLAPKEPAKLQEPAPTGLPKELLNTMHLAKFGLEIVKGRIVSQATGETLAKLGA